MGRLLVLLSILSFWSFSQAGQPLPPEAQYLTREQFRKVNPIIDEDWTDYVQDLAAEYVTCDAVTGDRLGAYTLPGVVTPLRKRPVGLLMDYVQGLGSTRQEQDAYAKEIFTKWIAQDPYRKQVVTAENYGCSVAPGCRDGRGGYTVIGCAFVPACEIDGCIAEPTQPPLPVVMPKAKAFRSDQYNIAENMFGTAWDRSYLLENLSGIETDCEMIGAARWGFDQAKEQARYRQFTVYGRFGYAPNLGRTEPALEQILQDIKDEELNSNVGNVLDLKMGCSVIADCLSSRTGRPSQIYVVVGCLFSTDVPRDIYDY